MTLSNLDRLNKLYEIPDFVKEADCNTEEELSLLPASAFADECNYTREYPIHTKAACYLSNARFWDQNLNSDAGDPSTASELLKWAEVWGITKDVSSMLKKASAYSKDEVIPDDAFAMVFESAGERCRRYPIDTPHNLIKSAANLYRDRHAYPYPIRQEAAQKLLAKAAQVNVTLEHEPYFKRATGCSTGIDKQAFASHLMNRAAMLRNTAYDNLVSGLATGAKNVLTHGINDEVFVKTSALLDHIDRVAGLYLDYDRGLDLPEDVNTDKLEKTASESPACVQLTTGGTVKLADLQTVGEEAFKAMPEYSHAVMTSGRYDFRKAADIVPTMPIADAALFERAIQAASA